jgi:hypothetical protein
MSTDQEHGTESPTLAQATEKAESDLGKRLLTDEDLLILSCGEIARSFTRDEKNYR